MKTNYEYRCPSRNFLLQIICPFKFNSVSEYEWGSVPVLEVEGKQLAQSKAILRYLGKKYSLAGENDFEEAKCDEHVEAMSDLRLGK
jgi:hypothetical protein